MAASALIADLTPLEARTDVQGIADAAMWLTAAVGGGLSGWIVAGWGYPVLNGFAAVLAGAAVSKLVAPSRAAAAMRTFGFATPALRWGAFAFVTAAELALAVGVALDTMRQMESQMMMRNYEGFLR